MFILLIFLLIGTTAMQAQVEPKNLSSQEVYDWIKTWKQEENNTFILGVLATVDKDAIPYTRTVAIREINEDGVLFFTQKGSKKVTHIDWNNSVSLTVLLPENKRQVTFRGKARSLSDEKNHEYWKTYPKISQIRFMVYGPLSGHVVSDNVKLDETLAQLIKKYDTKSPDKPDAYVGYQIYPEVIELYQLNHGKISDSFVLNKEHDQWKLARVVP